MIDKDTAIDLINLMYQAAICAVCNCDDNVEGMYPCDCDCNATAQRDKVLRMLRQVREEQINTINKITEQ